MNSFSPEVLRHAPWSVSKVGSLEKCQKQYELKYIKKVPEGPSMKTGRIGTFVHAVLERGLRNDVDDIIKLREYLLEVTANNKSANHENEYLDALEFLPACTKFIQRIRTFKINQNIVKIYIEHQLAMTSDFRPCEFRDKESFLRGVIDLALLTESNNLIVIDHKTGRPRPILNHYDQIYNYALMCNANFDIKGVQGIIHYVGVDELSRMPLMPVEEINSKLKPWLVTYLNRITSKILLLENKEAPAVTGWLCEWCSYLFEPGCMEGLAHVEKKASK